MFEHFGVMDIFSGIKKYKYIFFTVIISSVFFFIGLNMIKVRNFAKNIQNKNENIYISSSCYYVEPKTDILTKYDSSVYKLIPDDYVALLNTDFCRQHIFDKLITRYSNQFIIENSGIGKDGYSITPNDFNINMIKELYTAQKQPNSMIIQISSLTYNQELSRSIIDICDEFVSSNISDQITNSFLKFSGEVDKVIKSTDVSLENIDKEDKRKIVQPSTKAKYSLMSVIKSTVVPIFLVIVVCIFVIIIIGLINPTLNRSSDFDEYNVPIIGEVKNYKKFKETK